MNELMQIIDYLGEMIPGHTYLLDKNNTYVTCNLRQALSVGLKSPEEIRGKRNCDLPNFNESSEFIELYDKANLEVLSSGKTLLLEEPVPTESQIGESFLSIKMPLIENGIVNGIFGISISTKIFSDREQRILLEKDHLALTLSQIIRLLPGHIYWKNTSGVYLGCNDSQAKSLGFKSGEDVIGKTDYEISSNDEIASKIRENDQLVMKNGKELIFEEEVINSGKKSIMLSQKVPLRDSENKVSGILGSSLDITESKENQKLIDNMIQQKNSYLRIMSHELNQPSSNCNGLLELALEACKNHEFEEAIKFIKLAKSQSELIIPKLNHLFNYINFDLNQKKSKKTFCTLNEIFEKIYQANIVSLPASIEFKIKDEYSILNKRVLIDVENLYEILSILISNSIRHTVSGCITLSAKMKDNNHLHLIVKDTGKGISAEQLEILSKDILEIDLNSPLRKYLKFSSKIPYVKLIMSTIFGGKILINSSLNEGTEIILEIPLDQIDFSSETNNKGTSLKILIVEDNEVTLELELNQLKKLGFENIDTANTGFETIKLVNKKQYDLIFLDISLPDTDGIQLFKKFKDTACKNTPVAAITSHCADDDINYFNEVGIFTVLKKPLTLNDLKDFFISFNKLS